MPRFLLFEAIEKNITVRGRVRFSQGDPLSVVRDFTELIVFVILINECTRKVSCVHAIQIEEPLVPLIGLEIKRAVIASPADKLRLELLTRRQVTLSARGCPHIEMIFLVATLVASKEYAIVGGKIINGERAVVCAAGQRNAFSRANRNGVYIENPGFIG